MILGGKPSFTPFFAYFAHILRVKSFFKKNLSKNRGKHWAQKAEKQ